MMRRADGVRWGIALLVVAVAGTPACVPGVPILGTLPTTPMIALASIDNPPGAAQPAFVGGVARSQDVVAPIIDPIAETPRTFVATADESRAMVSAQRPDDAKTNDEVVVRDSANLENERDGNQ